MNRVEENKLYPAGEVPRIALRTKLYRNFDQEFERTLTRKSAERKIRIAWELTELPTGFALTVSDEDENRVTLSFPFAKEPARTPQADSLRSQLCKVGNTPFEVDGTLSAEGTGVLIDCSRDWFLPASVVADWRRRLIERLEAARRITYRRELAFWKETDHAYPAKTLTYTGNVMNNAARSFYAGHGLTSVAPAYEVQPVPEAVLMFCKHCLRYSMGWCPVHQDKRSPYREPYYLVGGDGRRFRLGFDCANCQMKVYAVKETE